MPSPIPPAEKRDDIRKLAAIDKRHGFLRAEADGGVTESWFDNNAFIIHTERDGQGKPLVGVMLKYPSECPADNTATVQIKYWVADLARKDELAPAFKANIQAIHDEMVTLGVRRVWGAVPKNAHHLLLLLDPIAVAAKCEKVDGASVLSAGEVLSPYSRFWFFVGDLDDVNDEVQGIA